MAVGNIGGWECGITTGRQRNPRNRDGSGVWRRRPRGGGGGGVCFARPFGVCRRWLRGRGQPPGRQPLDRQRGGATGGGGGGFIIPHRRGRTAGAGGRRQGRAAAPPPAAAGTAGPVVLAVVVGTVEGERGAAGGHRGARARGVGQGSHDGDGSDVGSVGRGDRPRGSHHARGGKRLAIRDCGSVRRDRDDQSGGGVCWDLPRGTFWWR